MNEPAIAQRTGRILLIEDNLINQRVVTRILDKAGHAVTATDTAEEGLELFGAGPFHLVILDLQLPGMDGLEAARRIRRDHLSTVPILALTAHAGDTHREAALEAGMDGFLTKPIEPRVLVEEVSRLLTAASGEADPPSGRGRP